MFKGSFVLSLALGAAVLVGCEKEDTSKPATPTPANPPAQPQATGTGAGAGEEMKKTASGAADTAKGALDSAAKNTADAAKGATDAAKTGAADAKAGADAAAAKATDTTANATDNAAAATQAQTLLDQVNQYIKDKKFDDADAALKKLEGMQDKLPDAIKSQIPTARKAIDAGKALTGGGTGAASELPKVPGLSK